MKRDIAEEKKAANAPEDKSGWSQEQQQKMEEGMKQFPASMAAKERWIAISKVVEGKTPKECFARFKDLCDKAKKWLILKFINLNLIISTKITKLF